MIEEGGAIEVRGVRETKEGVRVWEGVAEVSMEDVRRNEEDAFLVVESVAGTELKEAEDSDGFRMWFAADGVRARRAS